ncbi:MAG: hypothetical protein C0407_16445 [Desulfobacca sp.]|nr:hypothetical protein [Desulfobacca sp.]
MQKAYVPSPRIPPPLPGRRVGGYTPKGETRSPDVVPVETGNKFFYPGSRVALRLPGMTKMGCKNRIARGPSGLILFYPERIFWQGG